MRTLTTDDEARCLMPGGEPRTHAVLFYDPADPASEAVLERYGGLHWPTEWVVLALDAVSAVGTTTWFGVRSFPTVAVIHEGMLLAFEQNCDRGACDRVQQFAFRQVWNLLNSEA